MGINIGNKEITSLIMGGKEIQLITRIIDNVILYQKNDTTKTKIKITGNSFSTVSQHITADGDVTVRWGDGTKSINNYTHTYSESGNYTIVFSGDILSLNENCFVSFSQIDTVELSDTITSLGANCFMSCVNLSSIKLPSGLESIGDLCFANCYTALSYIDIPESVILIGDRCFASCLSLTHIKLNWTQLDNIIPYNSNWTEMYNNVDNVKYIVPYNTKQLYVDKGYPIEKLIEGRTMSLHLRGQEFIKKEYSGISSDSDIVVLWGDDTKTINEFSHTYTKLKEYLIEFIGEMKVIGLNGVGFFENCTELIDINIPNGITTLAMNSFYGCTNLKEVQLPSTLTTLGMGCFYNCSKLSSITIPNNVTSIPISCFEGCSSLNNVVIPSSITSLGTRCFLNCSSLETIDLPNTITSLPDGCFTSSGLININLPSNLQILGEAFYGCYSLKEIEIPENVTNITGRCFGNCYNLNNIIFNWNSSDTILPYNNSWITGVDTSFNTVKFTIPYGTTQLYINKGYPIEKLEEKELSYIEMVINGSEVYSYEPNPIVGDGDIYIDWGDGSSLEEYDNEYFYHEYSESDYYTIKIYGNITELKEKAFYETSVLENIILPDTITIIGKNCFESCSNLSSIRLPQTITELQNDTFAQCTSLSSITIPNGVITIGENCFSNCSSLVEVIIPASVTTIYDGCFEYCGFSNITIPQGVTTIGQQCFYYCENLLSVTIPQSLTTLGRNCFDLSPNINSYYLNWTQTNEIIPYLYREEEIFPVNSNTVFYIPEETSLLYVKKGYPLDKLSRNELSYIEIIINGDIIEPYSGTYMFDNDSPLLVDWGDNTPMEKLDGFYYFYHQYETSDIYSVKIYGDIRGIEGGAFEGLDVITEAIIPNGITTLEAYCFCGCVSLTSVTLPNTITTMENYCFEECTSLNNYYLNWETSETIIEYSSDKMLTNSDTKFYVPYGTKQLYINAGYPSGKLEEGEPPISLISDKFILSYVNSDSTTLTATHKNGGGQTVQLYNSNDNSLVGTMTDNNDGTYNYVYTSTGAGDISFYAKSEDLISENCIIQDWEIYETSSSSNGLSLFGPVKHYTGSRNSTLSWDNSQSAYKVVTGSGTNHSFFPITSLTDIENLYIEFEIKGNSNYCYPGLCIQYWQDTTIDSSNTGKQCHYRGITGYNTWIEGMGDGMTTYKVTSNSASNGTWYKVIVSIIDYECTFQLYTLNGTKIYENTRTLEHMDNNTKHYGVICGWDGNTTKWYRNIKAKRI